MDGIPEVESKDAIGGGILYTLKDNYIEPSVPPPAYSENHHPLPYVDNLEPIQFTSQRGKEDKIEKQDGDQHRQQAKQREKALQEKLEKLQKLKKKLNSLNFHFETVSCCASLLLYVHDRFPLFCCRFGVFFC